MPKHENRIFSLQRCITVLPDFQQVAALIVAALCKRKGKERKSIYIAPFCTKVHTKRSGMDHTVLAANNAMPAFFFVRVHQMSPPQQLRQQTSNCSSLLIYRPRKNERLSWPSWLTHSGWLTHQLQVERRTAKAHRPKTDALPLDHATRPGHYIFALWILLLSSIFFPLVA